MGKIKNLVQLNSRISKLNWTRCQKFYVHIIKPLLDFFFAIIGLILLSPLFFVIAITIKIDSRGPVFFKQKRVGKNNELFYLIKFRSMTVPLDSEGNSLKDMERMTGVGSFIRKFSLDELPQLINILSGKMSFIGPRPLLVSYLPLYTPEQMKRHCVTPGISGWAQVNGRNAIEWKEKFKLDILYVDKISFIFDLKILFMTIWNVLCRRGINNSVDDTMPFFKVRNKSVNS